MNETLQIVKDIVLIGAGITTATVAVKGLSAWKKQSKSQSHYELARRVLVSLLKFRDALYDVRHPAMWIEEMPNPPKHEADKMDFEEIRYYGRSRAYQNRWDQVKKAETELYGNLVEAEAVWGGELNQLISELHKLKHELFTGIRNMLDLENPKTDQATKHAIEKSNLNRRDIIFDDLSESGDEYKNDVSQVIEKIREYLQPKLSHDDI